jgi:hypothetical protein
MLTSIVQVVAYGSAASVLIPLGPWLTRIGLPGFVAWLLACAAGAVFGLLMVVALMRLPGLWERFPDESLNVLEQLVPCVIIFVLAGVLLPTFARARAVRGLPPLEPPVWVALVPLTLLVLMLALHLWSHVARSRRR